MLLISDTLYLIVFVVLASLAAWDIKSLILPDPLLLLLGVLGLGLKELQGVFLPLYGIFTFLGISLGLKVIYRWKTCQEGLGWGDVKFLTLSGLWVPFEHIPFFLILVGSIGCMGSVCWQWAGKGKKFPLGAVIAGVLSGWVVN